MSTFLPSPLVVQIDRTPPRILSPNSKAHRRTREPYRDELKLAAAMATQNVLVGRTWAWDGPIILYIHIAWDHGQRLDYDNAISISKYAVDGVFAKLDANDRQVEGVHVSQTTGNKTPGMIIQVEPVAERTSR